MEQYVVTGIGIYNSLGKTAEESWTNLLAGKSAAAKSHGPKMILVNILPHTQV